MPCYPSNWKSQHFLQRRNVNGIGYLNGSARLKTAHLTTKRLSTVCEFFWSLRGVGLENPRILLTCQLEETLKDNFKSPSPQVLLKLSVSCREGDEIGRWIMAGRKPRQPSSQGLVRSHHLKALQNLSSSFRRMNFLSDRSPQMPCVLFSLVCTSLPQGQMGRLACLCYSVILLT